MIPLEGFHKDNAAKDKKLTVCKLCNYAKTRAWILANPDKSKEGSKRRYATNPQKKISRDAWKAANKNRHYASQKKWLDANRDKHDKSVRNWERNNPEKKLATCAKRRARKLNAMPAWLTPIQLAQMQEMYDVALACSVQTGVKHHVDHIVPLNGKGFSGLHVPWNLQVITASANLGKANRIPVEYARLFWDAA